MSFPATTSLKVVKNFQWAKETVYAIPDSAVTFVAEPIQDYTASVAINNVKYRILGGPYLYKAMKIGERYRVALAFQPINKTLLEFGVNDTGTNNRNQSITGLLSQMQNQAGTLTEMFEIAKGMQCNSTTIAGSNEAAAVTQEWFASDITTWNTTHGLNTPTFASALTGTPWTGLAGGTNPLTFNGVNQKIRGYSVTVNNAIDEVQTIGDAQIQWATPTIHECTLSIDVVFKDTTLIADVKTLTPRAMTLNIGTGPTTLTFEDTYLEAYDETISANDTTTKTISYSGFAKKCTI